ncbi:MAG: VTC domain-containing protein [Bacteriovoracaceae bacterium]|nr:VTC domain-containing protein [Bacteriovoracaceae bacterium]
MSEWRFEKKIPLKFEDLLALESIVQTHPAGLVTAYPKRIVKNLYFDTPDLLSYFSHVNGFQKRNKWRLRAYDDSSWRTLEEKRKDGDLGHKFYHDPTNAISAAETHSSILCYEKLLYPVLMNRYERQYYVSSCHSIRLTIDSQIEFKSPTCGHWLRDPEFVAVAEIKYDLDKAREGQGFLEKFPWPVNRYSKYIRGLKLIDGI